MKSVKIIRKQRISNNSAHGTDFETQHPVQLKITNRDLLLLAGIVVAIVIAIASWIADVSAHAETPRLFPSTSKILVPADIHKIGKSAIQYN